MAVLDVWIAQPGSACRVDDHSWIVTVFDAHANIFEWAGITYTNLSAPNGHWAGKLPPGTYVVQAVSSDTGVSTDHAIVAVECNDAACIRLFVPGQQAPPTDRCQINVKDAVGLLTDPKSTDATIVQVTGTATKCKEVQVVVTCQPGNGQTTVTVQADGTWQANVPIKRSGCRCGGSLRILASCTENKNCVTEFE